MPKLAGVAEAAALLGIRASSLADRRRHDPDFPEPIARLACGPIWRLDELRAYKRRYDRKTRDRRLWDQLGARSD